MKVVDDFLPDELFIELSYWLCGTNIPWYFNPYVAMANEPDNLDCYFTHTFYIDDNWCSSLGDNIVRKLVDEIKNLTVDTEWEIKSLLRIKGNIFPQTEILRSHMKHRDFEFSHKAMLIYLNDNDGYTEFPDGERVKSQSNRAAFFDGSSLHNSTNCTTQKSRVTLGINYF